MKDNGIDLIITHPPYLNIIKYSNVGIDEDLSNISSVTKFCNESVLLIMHEHLFIFRKPKHDEDLNRIRDSLRLR